MHTFSKNLEATLKMYSPECWYKVSSTLRTHKNLGATVKNLFAKFFEPGIFAPLVKTL